MQLPEYINNYNSYLPLLNKSWTMYNVRPHLHPVPLIQVIAHVLAESSV